MAAMNVESDPRSPDGPWTVALLDSDRRHRELGEALREAIGGLSKGCPTSSERSFTLDIIFFGM